MSKFKSWKWTESKLIEAIGKSNSFIQLLNILGLAISGSNYRAIKRAIKKYNISTSHWIDRRTIGGTHKGHAARKPLNEVLVENSTYSSNALKKRLIKEKLIDYKCAICHMDDKWLGKKLTLQLDHINGINNDNRLENLRFLCPNCHSQTPTYAGHRFKGQKIKSEDEYTKSYCQDCGILLKYYYTDKVKTCRNCYNNKIRSYDWVKLPTDDELYRKICASNILEVSKELGVSDTTLKNILEDKNMLDKIRNNPNYDPYSKIKIQWNIDGEELLNMVNTLGFAEAAKKLEVSPASIKRRLKKLSLYSKVVINKGGRPKTQ
jgi:Zn finger protein HypA/HybF involved in hydrogenase expression